MNQTNEHHHVLIDYYFGEDLHTHALSSDAKNVLDIDTITIIENIGLPEDSGLIFNRVQLTPFPQQFSVVFEDPKLVLIGRQPAFNLEAGLPDELLKLGLTPIKENKYFPICIDTNTGEVKFVLTFLDENSRLQLPINKEFKFINSSLRQYLVSLIYVQNFTTICDVIGKQVYGHKPKHMAYSTDAIFDTVDAEIDWITNITKQKLREIDENVFKEEDYWTQGLLFIL